MTEISLIVTLNNQLLTHSRHAGDTEDVFSTLTPGVLMCRRDWRGSCTYGRAPIAIDISQGSLTCLHRHGTTIFIRWFRHTAPLVAFYDTLGIRRTYSRLKPLASVRRGGGGRGKCTRCWRDDMSRDVLYGCNILLKKNLRQATIE